MLKRNRLGEAGTIFLEKVNKVNHAADLLKYAPSHESWECWTV